jgi:AcrR family transcriptional regulator
VLSYEKSFVAMARTPKGVEDRREQILDAAMRAFAQKGFKRATNKDIAREAGITPGLIYHYFENKEALFKAIIEGRSPLGMLRSLPQEMLELPPETFLPFLLKQALGIIEGEDFVRLIRVILPEIVHNPEMSPLGVSVLQQVLGFLANYLTLKMESGQMRQKDASLIAQILLGSMVGFVLRRQILRDPVALMLTQEQIATAIVDTVLYGLDPN